MLAHLLALAVPIAGIVCVILFQLPGDARRKKPRPASTKGDTSAKSQGDDHRRTGEQE